MLHPDFDRILQKAHELRFYVSIKTNGNLLSREFVRSTLLGRAHHIEITLFSLSDEINARLAGVPYNTARLLETIIEFKDSLKISCSIAALPENIRTLKPLLEWLKKNGIDWDGDTMIFPPQKEKLEEFISKNLTLSEKVIVHRLFDEMKHFADIIDKIAFNDMMKSKQKDMMCAAGAEMLYINPFGEITPCISLPLVLGHAGRDTLEDAKKFFITEYSEMLQKKSSIPELCQGCVLDPKCTYCPGLAYRLNGSTRKMSSFICDDLKSRRTER
jgi:radical SAM protein with 4Fe4S-binding SPASM domain